MMERVSIIGVKISAVNFTTACNYFFDNFEKARGNYICAANVHTTVYAHDNPDYRLIQDNSFMTLPDGKPLSVVGKRKGFKNMGRVTGPDFMEAVIRNTENSEKKHFFYGTTEKNIEALIVFLKNKYPNLNICGYEPSLFRDLSDSEKNDLRDKIKSTGADFVWVALGAPRQEKFCEEMCRGTNAVWVAVGGAFNVISGVIPRAPKWIQKIGMEWFYRMMKEPRRLFKRYFVTNTKFIWYLMTKR